MESPLSLREAREKIRLFIEQFNFDVGYWDGDELTCYRLVDDTLAPFAAKDDLDEPEGSNVKLLWNQTAQDLLSIPCPIILAKTPELKDQWKKEWAATGKGPGMIPFVLDALNPETGKKDGVQYTFGNTHVAQALARYGDAAGKLGSIKTTLGHYEEGLAVLRNLPMNLPVRNTLFRVWKTHWEGQFEGMLQGKAKTYLFNFLATKYRSYLHNEAVDTLPSEASNAD